jgi:hypothetical protein
MATDTDVLDRVAELERRASRLILAGDGTDQWAGWRNLLEIRLAQEIDSERAVLTEVVASLQRDFEATAKRIVDEAAARHVRGTYDPKSKYGLGDVIALDGGSFISRKDNPGKCPGPDWQLVARQGSRGVAGEKGERGRDAPRIVGWVVDRSAYTVAPRFSDGTTGPLLELRELFAPSQDEGAV